jgi:antitoxin component of RelBE/YafQ-DinJ toxin-antitoxin module
MITQMIFRIDNKLKQAAQKRAKKQGITLGDLYKQATESFVAGDLAVTFTPTPPEIPNARTARSLRAALRDIKLNRNFSPSFDNAKDAIAYLKKYAG